MEEKEDPNSNWSVISNDDPSSLRPPFRLKKHPKTATLMTTMRRKLAMLGFVVFGLCLATQLTFVKLHLSNSPPRTIAIHFELPVPRSIWDASAVLLMVLSLAVLLLAAFCHGSLGPLTTVACDRDRTERDLELRWKCKHAVPRENSWRWRQRERVPRDPLRTCFPRWRGFAGRFFLSIVFANSRGARNGKLDTTTREKQEADHLGLVRGFWQSLSGNGDGNWKNCFRLRGRCLPLEEHPDVNIVTKETYLDSEDEELFKEVAVGLLIPSSPYLGFATTIERAPRLISACLPFTARGYWEQGLTFVQQKDLATGMALAILHLHYLSLVHCGIKPDNFLVDAEGTVFVIDFGSVSREGDVPPMMCNSYRPPDEARAWDIYSLGKVFYELFGSRTDALPGKLVQILDGKPSTWSMGMGTKCVHVNAACVFDCARRFLLLAPPSNNLAMRRMRVMDVGCDVSSSCT